MKCFFCSRSLLIVVFVTVNILLGGFTFKEEEERQKPQLIYIFDPLCGWCYAFSPVMQDIKKDFGDKFDYQIMSGGLATGERTGPVKEIFGDYLEHALGFVESKSDVRFGNAYKELIREGSYVYNSEPPSVALFIVKQMKPEIAFDYAYRLHQVLFAEGKSLNDTTIFIGLSEEFNLNTDQFLEKFRDSLYLQGARKEFALADSLGAVGYPTILLKNNGKMSVITDGFQNYKRIRKKLEKELKKMK